MAQASGFAKSVSDIFGGMFNANGQQAQSASQQQSNTVGNNQQPLTNGTGAPGNIPGPGTQGTPPAGQSATVPGGTGNPADPNAVKNPLDEFNKLWENPAPVEGQNQPVSMFDIDPAKIREATSKVDFSTAFTPEVRAAINAGGEAGLAASITATNSMVQDVYARSTLATTKIVQKALAEAREQWNTELPGIMKKHGVGNSLRETNPVLNHPAVAPLTEALEARFVKQYPNASESQITEHVQNYLTSTFQSLFPDYQKVDPKTKDKATKGQQDEDWESFLSMG